MLHEFWVNFTHNLFKPLLLFFYFGFLIPIFKVRFEFPYVLYQGLTLYLLLAIGWHGGEELAKIKPSNVGAIVGFMVVGFALNFVIGTLAYFLLSKLTAMRRVDRATVAGYYGSDSAGTFATCVAVLTSVGMAFDAYMPVMLAVMEIPGCLVALYLVARLRHRGMNEAGYMADEPGYTTAAMIGAGPGTPARPAHSDSLTARRARHRRRVGARWKSASIQIGMKTASKTAARMRRSSHASCCRKFSSTRGSFSSSAASSSA